MKQRQIDRRRFIQTATIGSAPIAFASQNAEAETKKSKDTASSQDKPNVLFIMTDQHRADMMTCAGRDIVPTPHIDRIASRGVRFTNAYCPYPVCVASRMSLLTGLYSHSTGAIDNTDRLDWRLRTMPSHFAANGYLTALIGKMHFNDSHNHGFEFYTSINDWLMYLGPKVQHYANEIANHPMGKQFFKTVDDGGAGFPDLADVWNPSPWVGNVEPHDFSSMASKLKTEDHLDAFLARESVKFMRRYKDQPFFLMTSFMKPHSPFYPPREWAEKYPVESMKLPPVGDITGYPPHIQRRIKNHLSAGEKRLRAHRAGYLGNLAFVDTCVGMVYKELEDLGLLDNTIVVYTSDHGEMDGDHGLCQKFCLFEPSVAVPLIVSYPKRIPQNKVTTALTEYFGLYPTLTELAGLRQPENTTQVDFPNAPQQMDAKSFTGVLLDPALKGPPAAFSEFALKSSVPQYMIRTHRYKYIFNHGSTHELYDSKTDPGENTNRINDPKLKGKRDELHERLIAWYDPKTNPYRRKPEKK